MYFIYQCAQNNTFSILNHRHKHSFALHINDNSLLRPSDEQSVSPYEERFNNYYFANFSSISLAYKLLFLASFPCGFCCCCCHIYSIYVCFASFFGLPQPHSIDNIFPHFSFNVRCSMFHAVCYATIRCTMQEIGNSKLFANKSCTYPVAKEGKIL